ncbi:MAG: hypothetical protein J4G04_01255 [Nitrosopumilaceae archaeon]|nr:hypothetical protein [Nitrosopumilaceae archaeon]
MATCPGADESKVIVAGAWCHSIVPECARVVIISVRPRKNTRTINWLFGGMGGGRIVHYRIWIYSGFAGAHQECRVHPIGAFLWMARKHGVGSPEYDRYMVIRALYKRARGLAARIADMLGVPSNAAETVSCQDPLQKAWGQFGPEYDSTMKGMPALLHDLKGQAPAKYLEGIIPRSMTFVRRPGTPGHSNGSERIVRWFVARSRHVFCALPNWRAARNFGMVQTFAATCRRNGTPPYHAVLARGRDPEWDMSTSCASPPILPHTA